MSQLVQVSYVILWLLVVVLTVLVLLLYRQFGLIFMHGKQRLSLEGIDIGRKAPPLSLKLQGGRTFTTLDWTGSAPPDGPAYVLLFTLTTCGVCAHLRVVAPQLAALWKNVQMIWIGNREDFSEPLPEWWLAYGRENDAYEAMGVPGSPFCYVLRTDGTVLAKGLINGIDEIDNMLAGTLTNPANRPTRPLEINTVEGAAKLERSTA